MKRQTFYIRADLFEMRISPRAKLILAYLFRVSDRQGRSHPSVSTVAYRCGCCPNSARKALHELEGAGLVAVTPNSLPTRRGNRVHAANTYTLLFLTSQDAGAPLHGLKGGTPRDAGLRYDRDFTIDVPYGHSPSVSDRTDTDPDRRGPKPPYHSPKGPFSQLFTTLLRLVHGPVAVRPHLPGRMLTMKGVHIMKRLCMIMLFAVVLFTGCQRTPEVEFVVNKWDDTVEEKLAAAQDGTAGEGRQTFPDRWDEGPVTENDQLTLTARAEVIQKADEHYPVYRTRQHTVTQEEVVSLLEQLLSPPTSVTIPVDTKADWQQSYQEWLDDLAEQQAWVTAGKPRDGVDRDETLMSAEEIDRISKEYQRLIAEAPEELETTPVSDFSGLKLNEGARVYELADGSKATVEAMADSGFMSMEVFKGCSGSGYIYYQYTHEREKALGEVKPFLTVKMSREAAEEMLQKELDRLGLSGFTVARAAPANLCVMGRNDGQRPQSAGWGFQLRRSYGGYPLSAVSFMDSRALLYGDQDAFAYNQPIPDEMIEVFVDENGLQAIRCLNPKDIVSLESENVELLTFEQVQMRIKNALVTGMGAAKLDQPIPCTIYRLLLTTCTVRVKDSDDYYEMPCWVVFFTWNDGQAALVDNPQVMQEALILNAVDGSIVHGEYGY